MLVVVQLPTNIFHLFLEKNIRFVGLVSGTNSGPVLDPRGPKRGPFSGPEHGPRKFMVLVCHCCPHRVKEWWCGCVRSPPSEPHWCDVSAARRVATPDALSTIAARLARSGWLRADAIRNAFFQQIHSKPKPLQKWIKMHSFVPQSMWDGPQNRPQGRQCVTHRRPQNLCGKRVPKTVLMKAQIVGTVPDRHPIFHCHSIRRLTDISEIALKTCLKNPWNRLDTFLKTMLKHYQDIFQVSLNNL